MSLFAHECSLQATTLIERQRHLEAQATADGAASFRSRLVNAEQRGSAAHVGANKKLLSAAVGDVSAGITAWLLENECKRGGKHVALKWCHALGPDVAAYMTVKAVLDVLALKMPLNDVARSIAKYMLEELRFRRFQQQAPALFDYRMASFTTSNYEHMARSLAATAKYAELDMSDLDMAESTKLLVGVKLLDILIATTGMVELQSKRIAKSTKRKAGVVVRQEVVLVPAADTIEWLTKRNDMLAMMAPVNLPMVIPPLRWGPKERGGYRFALRGRHPLVRGADKKAQQERFAAAEMPLVYDTLNLLQETAWQVNPHVLNLVRLIKEGGHELAGVPAFEPYGMPPKPNDIDGDDDDSKERRRLYRKAKHAVHERNHARVVRTLEFSHVLHVANLLETDDAIFFPYNLDFRGRLYPVCSFLSPQGTDLSKGLLQFAEGKPLGPDGARWLALHGANCLGVTPLGGDKIAHWSLDDRIDWIDAHTQDIIGVAINPLGSTWWTGAEKPLQFYAFACEWAQLSAQKERFVSHLPIAQDGSCNGLQHFSAMFRDSVGGAAVNLIPTETPRDIYQTIADEVKDKLAARAVAEPLALLWLTAPVELVNRKLTKRPTMTFGYGSKKYGFADQLRDYLKGHDNWHALRAHFVDADGKSIVHDACDLMAALIWDALQVTVVAAGEGMTFMQHVVNEIVAAGTAVEWVVPATGFPVRQLYFEYVKKQIKTILAGKTIQPSYHQQLDTIRPIKQRNAIAPNVIHSLDAAALELTVTLAASRGVTAFGMVHDSYATHAADAGVLYTATREAFVSLYQDHNVIGSLYEQWCSQAADPAKCPPIPALGDLDLNVILASPFFFA